MTEVETWQNGSGIDPGPVPGGGAVDGEVKGARDEDAGALSINIVQVCRGGED